jgi:hypothetical protein
MKTRALKKNNNFGILCLIATPSAVVLLAIISFTLETFVGKPVNALLVRILLLTTIFLIGSGITCGIIALIKNEKPRWIPIAGLLLTLFIIVSFHFLSVGPNGD